MATVRNFSLDGRHYDEIEMLKVALLIEFLRVGCV